MSTPVSDAAADSAAVSRYRIVHRPAQPYAAIPLTVTMAELAGTAPPLMGEVFDWLAGHGAAPDGPPFWKYDVIDMARSLQLQVGVATAGPVQGDGRVVSGQLPAGSYLQTVHRGHPDTLERATGELLAHAEAQGLRFDEVDTADGERWTARLELYLTDPDDEPDLNAWETMLAFKLAE
jgi:effector-binding domain-containing protein